MSDMARTVQVKALLDAERAAGYAECYRTAVGRLRMLAMATAGSQGLTKRAAEDLRSTVGGMISDMQRHVHGPLAEALTAETRRDVEETLTRLGRPR